MCKKIKKKLSYICKYIKDPLGFFIFLCAILFCIDSYSQNYNNVYALENKIIKLQLKLSYRTLREERRELYKDVKAIGDSKSMPKDRARIKQEIKVINKEIEDIEKILN